MYPSVYHPSGCFVTFWERNLQSLKALLVLLNYTVFHTNNTIKSVLSNVKVEHCVILKITTLLCNLSTVSLLTCNKSHTFQAHDAQFPVWLNVVKKKKGTFICKSVVFRFRMQYKGWHAFPHK